MIARDKSSIYDLFFLENMKSFVALEKNFSPVLFVRFFLLLRSIIVLLFHGNLFPRRLVPL